MRRDPGKPPTVKAKQDDDLITLERTYRLITPLFGGGVEAGVPDVKRPISGKAIRGHLRFWWRATRGGMFGGSLEEMRKKEIEIWGGVGNTSGTPSSIIISVLEIPQINDTYHRYMFDANAKAIEDFAPAYVSFPLRPNENQAASFTLGHSRINGQNVKYFEFCIKYTFPYKYKAEFDAAHWAWQIFGGLGSRTRRGFGSFFEIETFANGKRFTANIYVPSSGEKVRSASLLRKYLQEHFTTHILLNEWPKNVPHLDLQAIRIFEEGRNIEDQWKLSIEKYQKFRQNRKNGEYGYSSWPEPDIIRYITGISDFKPKIDVFPRAVFGMPIMTHFPQGETPLDTTLIPPGKNRLGSPLIIRPLDTNAQKCIIFSTLKGNQLYDLYKDPSNDLELQYGLKKYSVRWCLEQEESKLIVLEGINPPMLNEKTDILQAFLETFKE